MVTSRVSTWAVYRVTPPGEVGSVRGVCRQAEWEAMEHAHPGRWELIRGGIASEAEAERLARQDGGPPPPLGRRERRTFHPDYVNPPRWRAGNPN